MNWNPLMLEREWSQENKKVPPPVPLILARKHNYLLPITLQSSYNEVLQRIMDKEVAVWSMMTPIYHLTFG